ncbi:MAG: hypothetical protein LBL43_04420 [Treponema sp.]|jgi:hypothetical protein|nr:hypothetical protein [Treponema sp.]
MAKSITMAVDYKNTIGLDEFKVNIVDEQKRWTISPGEPLQFGEGTMRVEMGKENMEWPFRPLMELLVPLEGGQNYGILDVRRAVVKDGFWGFEATAKVTVEAEIDKEFSF